MRPWKSQNRIRAPTEFQPVDGVHQNSNLPKLKHLINILPGQNWVKNLCVVVFRWLKRDQYVKGPTGCIMWSVHPYLCMYKYGQLAQLWNGKPGTVNWDENQAKW